MADKKISALTGASTPLGGTEVLPIVQSGATVKVSIANLTAGRGISVLSATVGKSVEGSTITWANSDVANVAFYQATNYPSAFIYGRVLDINAGSSNSGGGSTIRLLTADGNLAGSESVVIDKNGKVTVSRDNLAIGTAGKGIDFSANTHAAGMTSELLNDYEEGEITDYGISFDNLSTGITYASGRRNGKYTKIGRTVYFNGRIELTSKGSATGVARITGLPFAKDSTYNGGIQLYFYYGLSLVTTQPWAIIENSATTAVLKVPGAGATVNLTDANFNNDTEILFNGFYFV
jgi:hypothetical protein